MNSIAVARMYPYPGGRITLLKNLIHENLVCKVISYNLEKDPFKLIKFNINSFNKLKTYDFDTVLGVGLGSAGAMLYGLLYGKKTIFNLSGCRFKWYNIFNTNVLDELFSLLLAKKIVVPSKESKRVLSKRLPIVKNKITLIEEGARSLGKKRHKGFNLAFTLVKDESIYKLIIDNRKMFKNANIYFIRIKGISKVANGKEKKIKGVMADIMPKLDLMFICQTLEEFHSSTMIEAITNKVPFFNVNRSSAKKDIKGSSLLIPDLKIKTFVKYYESFRKDPHPVLTELDRLYNLITKKYNYGKMIKQWRKQLC